MQKLKIKNIAMLTTIVLVVGLLVFGKLYGFGFLSSQEDINQVVNSTTELSSASESPKRGLVTKTDIELPPEPVNGVTKGVVEVGASTFRCLTRVFLKKMYTLLSQVVLSKSQK